MRIANITVDCADPARVARFWTGALGYAESSLQAGDDNSWATTGDREAGQQRFYFQRVPEGKTVKNRVHLDVAARDMAAEVTRLVGLGARRDRVISEDGSTWTTMFDPEGNEFCVVAER